jgi:hypothetical protein
MMRAELEHLFAELDAAAKAWEIALDTKTRSGKNDPFALMVAMHNVLIPVAEAMHKLLAERLDAASHTLLNSADSDDKAK